jgi:uncharacterized membrane protein HdeD (DUF308 family)
MKHETIFLGITLIIIGIALMITRSPLTAIILIPTLLGIALILFGQKENIIEQRKDMVKPEQKLKK